MMNHPKRRLRIVPHLAAVVLLICAAPVEAGWFGRGVGVAGAGYAIKETLEENTGIFGKIVDAVIEGDGTRVSELAGEIKKTPGKLIRRAFPVLEAPHAVAEKLKSAKRKVGRFVGGVGERLTDARAALAVDRGGEGGGWNDAALLEGEPLSAPVEPQLAAPRPRYDSPAEVLAALGGDKVPRTSEGAGGKPAAASWDFEDWVVSEQEARPHCYGIVDPDTLPADCLGPVRAEMPAAKRAEDSSQAASEGFDWASGEWTPEDTGWAGWDSTDPRYSDEDRDAARVGVFAARCWGVYGVSRRDGLYGLMQERMQRNECPNEETADPAAASGDAGSEYAAALAGVLDEDSAAPAGGDYLAALNTLEEERREQARLAEEERRERVERRRLEEEHQLAEERRFDALERQQQAEYRKQALQNINEFLRILAEQMNRTSVPPGCWASGGGTVTCPFDYNKRP